MSIYKTPDAREKLLAWHERFRAKLVVSTQSRTLSTRFGDTHVLLCGPDDAPPLVLLHGALATSAHALGEVAGLAARFRVFALDIVGQSPLSAPNRLDVRGDAYGQWLRECLDALELPRVRLLGVSWGGFVTLRLAALAPERIEKLSLVVPAGLVQNNGPDALFQAGLPMLLYQAFPSPGRRERALAGLFTDFDSDWADYLGDALRLVRTDFRPPRLLRDGELAAFAAPVQVIAAGRDLSFPGQALLSRARAVFPNLADAHLLPGARHCPSFTPAARQELTQVLATFLAVPSPLPQ